MRAVIITSILQGFEQKTTFLEGWSWFKFNSLGLELVMALKFYTSVAKGSELKVRKLCEVIPSFVEVTEEMLVMGGWGRGGWEGLALPS